MYLMMNLLIFGGATMAAERRNGVIKRLMVHPVTRLELVMGKIYGLMLLGVVQILFFLAVGKFLFHVNLGANLPAVTLTLLVFAWVAGSLGVLVGSLTAARGSRDRDLRAGQPADGGAGRLLVAAGNRAARAQDHRALPADRLGVAGAASTHQLRQRLRRGAQAAGVLLAFGAAANSAGRPLFPELKMVGGKIRGQRSILPETRNQCRRAGAFLTFSDLYQISCMTST